MADDALQAALRTADANLDDAEAVERVITAHRRAGRPVPGRFLLAQTFPARSFDCREAGFVAVERPNGRVEELGRTGPGHPPVRIPIHRTWWFLSKCDTLLKSVRGHEVPGIQFERWWAHAWPKGFFEKIAKALPELVSLRVKESDQDGVVDLAPLAGLQRLRRFEYDGPPAGPDVDLLAGLLGLPDLAHISLDSVGLPIRLPATLVSLELRFVRPGWRLAARLPHLSRFSVPRGNLQDEDVRALIEQHPGLEDLTLSSCEKLHDFSWLRRTTLLRRLDLGTSTFGGKDVPLLAGARLRSLSLSRCLRLDDAAMTHIAKLTELRELALDYCPGITSKGLMKLKALTNLVRLDLRGKNRAAQAAQEKGRKALEKALPSCKILF